MAQVVSNVDFAPTLIELATGSAPAAGAPHDGRSFIAPVDLDRTLFTELGKDRNVVTQRFKLTATALEQVGTVGHGCKAAPQRPLPLLHAIPQFLPSSNPIMFSIPPPPLASL